MDIGVLTFVCAGLAILAARAVIRAVQRRHAEGAMGRAWWAAILVVATATALYFEVGHDRQERLVTYAMRPVVDNPAARGDCQRFTQTFFRLDTYEGFVSSDAPDVALYTNTTCRALASYASSNKLHPSLDQITAVHVIAHEAMHVNGYWNEAEAECRAVQLDYLVAERLGATPEQARKLQLRYFLEVYPRLRDNYISGACREGGALDIFPDRTAFP